MTAFLANRGDGCGGPGGQRSAVTFGAGGLFAVSAASPESSVVTLEPVRILDTRDPVNVGLDGPFVSPVAQDLKVTGSVPTTTGTKTVVPTGATGVFLNVTPVGSTAAGFISVRPANAAGLPSTSNVNFTTGATNPNAVLVELPVGGADDGKIEITFDASGVAGPTTDVLIDVVGYTSDAKLRALEANLANKADSADVYTKSESDTQLAKKADSADVYTKGESDAKYPQGYAALLADSLETAWPDGALRDVVVTCPSGMTATGGGGSNGGFGLALDGSFPVPFGSSSPTGWIAIYRNVSGVTISSNTIRAHVICMAVPGQAGALTATLTTGTDDGKS